MEKLPITISAIFMFFASLVSAQPEVEIPHAKPGSCYTKCLIADEYTTETEQIEIKAASFKVEIIPAEYASVSEQVLVREAATRIERVPAEYETETQSFVKGCPFGFEPDGGVLVSGGNCIQFISVPAEYETVTEQVLVKEAATRLEVIPPTYEMVKEQILVKPAYLPNWIIPAKYEMATEQVLVSEATVRIERKPARYKSQSEQIEIAPAGTKWVKKKADQNCLSADPNDCLVWCLIETPAVYQTINKKVRLNCEEGWTARGDDCIREVAVPAEYTTRTYSVLKTGTSHARPKEIPAEYKTVSKKVLKTSAQIRTIDIPAEYETRMVRKLKTAATTRTEIAPVVMDSYTTFVRKGCPVGFTEDISYNKLGDCIRTIAIPAEYTTRSFQKLTAPASVKTIPVPAEYTTVARRILVKKGGFTEWRQFNCSYGQVTNVVVRKIQDELRNRGYDPGPSDNIMSDKTKAALVQYQKDNDLPVGNLDVKTMKALGVSY